MSVSLPTSDPDIWVAQGITSRGLGGVRRRQTCDHEAIHAATAAALSHTLTSARVDRTGPYHGEVRSLPPSELDTDRRKMEDLIVTVAPSALGATRSSGDANDGFQLASEIAGNGVACMATGPARGEVLDRARREALALAETRTFKVVRQVVRQALEEHGSLDQGDLEAIILGANGRKPTAKSQPRRTVRNTTTTSRRRCSQCGCAYTPQSPTGKCRACRGDADG
jgi:hypothetical protein